MWGDARVSKFAAIEAGRLTREALTLKAGSRSGRWLVVKKNDDGREIVVRSDVSPDLAEQIAGRARDAMSDQEVGAGWSYLAISRLSEKSSRNEPVANEYR
jgi:hypothetical protein